MFAAIDADRYFINDRSSELIELYKNIATGNRRFFDLAQQIIDTWERAGLFFEKNKNLKGIYVDYRNDIITKTELQQRIKDFCSFSQTEIVGMLGKSFQTGLDILLSETYKNLFRKMTRMKVLEQERHLLPEKDLEDNIETAIKSALYMYFRHLYNDNKIKEEDKELHCALFFFIRNYCYSGMFRYNSDGDFNVPYGGIGYNSKTLDKKIKYYKSGALIEKLSDTSIKCSDFERFLDEYNPRENDFVFLDPPYDSEFSTYAKNEFTRRDHERLAEYMLNKCKAKWMLIIKNTDFIFNLYNKDGIKIRMFDKKYIVSFMNRNDRNTTHLLITNY